MFKDKELLNKIAKQTTELLNPQYNCEYFCMSENVTYIVYDKNNPLYTIRISKPDYRTYQQLKSEIDWLNMLNDIPVAKPVKVNDKYITELQGYFVVVFGYIKGEMPQYNDCNVMYECGRLSAMLHKSPKPYKADRPVWSIDNMTGKKGLWGDWRKNKALSINDIEIIENALKKITENINNYKTEKYGLIHMDLRITNIIKNTKYYAIDFDDCGYGYYMQDLASSLSFMENSTIIEALKEAWYKGYEEILPLSKEDKIIADSFIVLRRIQLLAWITSHSENDYVKTVSKDFEKNTIEIIKKQPQNTFK